MCSCSGSKLNSETYRKDALKIQIGLPSKVVFNKSAGWWIFDVPVNLTNESNHTLYFPNLEDPYQSGAHLNFFLVNRDGIILEERINEMVPILGVYSWNRLAAGKSIVFSKHVIVNKMEVMDAPNDSGRIINIEFFSNSCMGDSYKIREGEYTFYARFTCDNQRSEDQKWWLEQVRLPVNHTELSKFWNGKIESNHLTLELKEE